MARASQSLQVLLIVFVMLTVVLGVTTYLYNKRADEATKAAVAAEGRERDAKKAAEDMQKERDVLKSCIGYPDIATDEIKKKFGEEMQTYGNEKKSDADPGKGGDSPLFDPTSLAYSRLLASMNKVIQDRTDELIHSRNQYVELDGKFKTREKAKDDTIVALSTNYDKLNSQVKDIANEFKTSTAATAAETIRMTSKVTSIKKGAEDEANKYKTEATQARKAMQAKEGEIQDLVKKQEKVDRKEMDVPSGEITWVSLPNKLVWINRGRADDLPRQTKFTVYAAGSSTGPTAVKKGIVEVVRIEGDHSSQCRILEDKLADPIMTGDKVFTPLWSPGQRNHFALTGIMNLDGDGRNQLGAVLRLINENGGAVDCWIDDSGHKQGTITATTRYIVVGDNPDKSSAEFMKSHSEILRDGERYRLQVMKLGDFKQQMGYEKSSSVEHFGRSTSSGDGSRAAPVAKPKSKAAASEDAK